MKTGKTDKFDELRELAEKSVKYNVFRKLTKHGLYGINWGSLTVFYRATDGETLCVTKNGSYTARYDITPDYLIDYIKQGIKAVNRSRYITGRNKLRDDAIEWQNNAPENMSYMELADAQSKFLKQAKRYGMVRELKENGIL